MNLEELCNLGKVNREVDVLEGVKVKFHTLTVGEEQKISEFLSTLPNDILARAKPLQVETLAYAIESINGKTFSDVKELRTYLGTLQGLVLDSFYMSYISMEKESIESVEKLKKNSAGSKAD